MGKGMKYKDGRYSFRINNDFKEEFQTLCEEHYGKPMSTVVIELMTERLMEEREKNGGRIESKKKRNIFGDLVLEPEEYVDTSGFGWPDDYDDPENDDEDYYH